MVLRRMHRSATGIIVGAAVALALAAGFMAMSAMARSDSGTLAGEALLEQRGRAVVEVFNAAGWLVARDGVSYPRGHFRFVLKPGRYKVKLKPLHGRWHIFRYCPHERTARVHANRTPTSRSAKAARPRTSDVPLASQLIEKEVPTLNRGAFPSATNSEAARFAKG